MNKECQLRTVDGFTIAATHTVSRGEGVVLWLHGITVNRDEYQDFFKDGAEFLSAAGLDSLRIDFRGHGASSGASLDFSVVGQMLDVGAALDYLATYYKKPVNLVIVGCSFGAPPALFTTAQNNNTIKGLVLIAPVLSYSRTFLQPETDWGRSLFNKETLLGLKQTNQLFINPDFPISSRLVEEMRLIKPENALQAIKREIVIMHGDADSLVPFAASKDFAKDNAAITFIPFPGMEHGFMDADDESGKGPRSLENKMRMYQIIRDQFV
jgi:pimeloyl-ACP methyl ester carboxylesterase